MSNAVAGIILVILSRSATFLSELLLSKLPQTVKRDEITAGGYTDGFVRNPTDTYVAESLRIAGAQAVTKSRLPISFETIKVVVAAGWATLEGEVEWQCQKGIAEKVARRVRGVNGVLNNIALKPRAGLTNSGRK
jgi:osmotically-inducible protein OsmY